MRGERRRSSPGAIAQANRLEIGPARCNIGFDDQVEPCLEDVARRSGIQSIVTDPGAIGVHSLKR